LCVLVQFISVSVIRLSMCLLLSNYISYLVLWLGSRVSQHYAQLGARCLTCTMTIFPLPPNATPTSAFSPVSPLEHEPCRLVFCFDSTAYPFQTNYSNVIKLFFLLRDDETQKVCYQPGVGYRIEPGFWSSIIRHSTLRRYGKILDDAFALYLHQHVMDGYKWVLSWRIHCSSPCSDATQGWSGLAGQIGQRK